MTTVSVSVTTTEGDSSVTRTANATAEQTAEWDPLRRLDGGPAPDSLVRTLARELFEEIERNSGTPQPVTDRKTGEVVGWVHWSKSYSAPFKPVAPGEPA